MYCIAPTYRHDNPLQLELRGNVIRLDWTKSFYLNSELEQFVVFVNSTAVYIGSSTTFTHSLPTTSTTTVGTTDFPVNLYRHCIKVCMQWVNYITLQLKFAIASLTIDEVQRCITKHK